MYLTLQKGQILPTMPLRRSCFECILRIKGLGGRVFFFVNVCQLLFCKYKTYFFFFSRLLNILEEFKMA